MKRRIWMAILSLAFILVVLIIFFHYTPKEQTIKEGLLVENVEVWEYKT